MPSERLVEYYIPYLSEINHEAQKEKKGNAKPPMFELLFWRTRKPLIVSRAVILASILPKDFNEKVFRDILALGKEKRAHNYSPERRHIELVKEIIKRDWDNDIAVLDPFAGGGSIPFESLRLGVPAVALEYNPVAWLLLKVIEWSHIYGDRLINLELFKKNKNIDMLCKENDENLKKYGDLIYWGCQIINKLREELSQFYPDYNGKKVVAYIWVRQIRCPNCGTLIPLTLDWHLSEKKNIYFVPLYRGNDYDIVIVKQGKPPATTAVKGKAEVQCPKCNYRISDEYVKKHVKDNDRLVVLALEGKEYVVARNIDVEAVKRAKQYLEQRQDLIQLLPNEEIVPNETRSVWVVLYGYTKFSDLFNPRQLLILTSLIKAIREVREELIRRGVEPNYINAITGILSLLVAKHADYNSAFTTWHSLNEQVAHTLSFGGIDFTWNYVEVNPFVKFSGSLLNNFIDIIEGIVYIIDKLKHVYNIKYEVLFGSALRLPYPDKHFKLIITDPPYYDDVPYAEINDFFYVWLKRILGDVFPGQFGFYTLWRDRSAEELSVGGSRDEKYFEVNLIRTFREIRRVLRDDGLLVLFFAHSSVDAWVSVLKMLLESGFQVFAIHPVKTESPESVIARGKLSFESSIVIVCRPRPSGGKAYIEELYPEITEEVRRAVKSAWERGYRGADLILSAFGTALKVVTKYSEIKSHSGKSFENLLDYVYELTTTQITETVLNKPLGAVDPYTAFYVYVRTMPDYYSVKEGKIKISADEFLKLSRSFKISAGELNKRGLVRESRSSGRKVFEVLRFNERRLPSAPAFNSIIDALHFLLLRFSDGGVKAVEQVIQQARFERFTISDVCDVAYALSTSCPTEDEETRLMKQFSQAFCRKGIRLTSPTLDRYL